MILPQPVLPDSTKVPARKVKLPMAGYTRGKAYGRGMMGPLIPKASG